jgi:hypothetical protein
MGGWQVVASVIGSLAWPVAVVALALLFRRPLRHLLSGQVRRWKVGPGGLEMEFGEDLGEHVAATQVVLEQATAELNHQITDLEAQIAARGEADHNLGPVGNERDALKRELEQLRRKLRVSNQALRSLEETLDHMASLPPGVRGTVTFTAVTGRRPTVTFEVVRPQAASEKTE